MNDSMSTTTYLTSDVTLESTIFISKESTSYPSGSLTTYSSSKSETSGIFVRVMVGSIFGITIIIISILIIVLLLKRHKANKKMKSDSQNLAKEIKRGVEDDGVENDTNV